MTDLSSKLARPRELSRRAGAMPRSAIREIMALRPAAPMSSIWMHGARRRRPSERDTAIRK
jgi:hypothetical protein